MSAPLHIAGEHVAPHRQPGAAGLEHGLARGLREGPGVGPVVALCDHQAAYNQHETTGGVGHL